MYRVSDSNRLNTFMENRRAFWMSRYGMKIICVMLHKIVRCLAIVKSINSIIHIRFVISSLYVYNNHMIRLLNLFVCVHYFHVLEIALIGLNPLILPSYDYWRKSKHTFKGLTLPYPRVKICGRTPTFFAGLIFCLYTNVVCRLFCSHMVQEVVTTVT